MEKKSIINYPLLWKKLGDYVKKAGRVSTRPLLLLYYVMKSPNTPKSDKLLIASAISYLMLPIDLNSTRRLPLIGWIDEVVLLTVVYQKTCKHITPETESEVDNILEHWFPECKYEQILPNN